MRSAAISTVAIGFFHKESKKGDIIQDRKSEIKEEKQEEKKT